MFLFFLILQYFLDIRMKALINILQMVILTKINKFYIRQLVIQKQGLNLR